jgi:hypothetical protein
MSTAGQSHVLLPHAVLIVCVEAEDTTAAPPIEDEPKDSTKTSLETPRISTESTSSGTSNLVGSLGRVSISSEIPRETDSHLVFSLPPVLYVCILIGEWDFAHHGFVTEWHGYFFLTITNILIGTRKRDHSGRETEIGLRV